MPEIKLTQDKTVLVDDYDWELVSQHKWYPRTNNSGVSYARTSAKSGNLYMHRLIMGAKPEQQVDHINGNGLDNRRENLRLCTNQQNQWNMQKSYGLTSKYKGVYLYKNRWRARITFQGKTISLGLFSLEEEAAQAYSKAALKYFGEFAYVNNV